MLPQLFAYALNFPIQKFLQAQRKVFVMAWVSAVVLVLHTFFSWLFILKLEYGLVGAAITLNTSWWLVVIGQLLYIFITKSDGAWSGFTWLAFSDLFGFVKLSLASAVMLWYIQTLPPLSLLFCHSAIILHPLWIHCDFHFSLEFWYLMILVVITGRLNNPLIPVDAISIWYDSCSPSNFYCIFYFERRILMNFLTSFVFILFEIQCFVIKCANIYNEPFFAAWTLTDGMRWLQLDLMLP